MFLIIPWLTKFFLLVVIPSDRDFQDGFQDWVPSLFEYEYNGDIAVGKWANTNTWDSVAYLNKYMISWNEVPVNSKSLGKQVL